MKVIVIETLGYEPAKKMKDRVIKSATNKNYTSNA